MRPTLISLKDLEVRPPLNLDMVSIGIISVCACKCESPLALQRLNNLGIAKQFAYSYLKVLKSLKEINFSLYKEKMEHIFHYCVFFF